MIYFGAGNILFFKIILKQDTAVKKVILIDISDTRTSMITIIYSILKNINIAKKMIIKRAKQMNHSNILINFTGFII